MTSGDNGPIVLADHRLLNTSMGRQDASIVIAEDDDDDYLLTERAFQESHFRGALHRVNDGEELMSFLLKGGSSSQSEALLLLLDLNMPRKDGRDSLREIKSHPDLRRIPVVVLTTSVSESDIAMVYELGANSFIRKPENFGEFSVLIKTLIKYWFEVSELPLLRGSQSIL